MNTFWELLFNAWVPAYEDRMAPDYLKEDPVRAYGQYAFREGVLLGLSLATDSFRRWED